MKQIAQNYKTGALNLVDTPVPACRPGGVLVRTEHSLVSVGTELMKVDESKLSLLGKARARPEKVQQVLQSVAQQGAVSTYRKVTNRLDSLTPLGYSLCGTVIEVGDGVTDLAVGQRVACAGNSFALHAEFNWVPRNLCAPVPDGVSSEHAAFTTVGSIAMHGFRQSEATLGEVACVIGLGLVGQLLAQILTAAGVRVVGVDFAADRCKLAEEAGAIACGSPDDESVARLEGRIAAATGGAGADHVLITAGGDSNAPLELATRLARDRARVVDIGKTRLDISWNAWYEKELELRLSRSYGPGRYDAQYEERGVDYPLPYVRWTEGRNLACFLDLIARGDIDLAPLVSAIVPFADAAQLYEDLRSKQREGIGFVFRYRDDAPVSRRLEPTVDTTRPRVPAATGGVLGVGVIGAGNYATSMILPHLAERDDVRIAEIATSTGLSAANALRRFDAARISTDYHGLLEDPSIGAVFVLTRHDSHATMVAEALRAGKTVFVEKPLAVDAEQLDQVLAAVDDTGNDRLMVGYNRRFAPLLTELRRAWGTVSVPQQLVYTVNAGRLASDNWYVQAGQGGRIVGEGGHFVDTASWWLGDDPVDVTAVSTDDPDDAIVVLRYPSGSVATIVYATDGDAGYPKEHLQVFGGGRVAAMYNFKRTELWHGGKSRARRTYRGIDKGQRVEVGAFLDAAASGGPLPIAMESLVATSRATFAAVEALSAHVAHPVAPQPYADVEAEAATEVLDTAAMPSDKAISAGDTDASAMGTDGPDRG